MGLRRLKAFHLQATVANGFATVPKPPFRQTYCSVRVCNGATVKRCTHHHTIKASASLILLLLPMYLYRFNRFTVSKSVAAWDLPKRSRPYSPFHRFTVSPHRPSPLSHLKAGRNPEGTEAGWSMGINRPRGRPRSAQAWIPALAQLQGFDLARRGAGTISSGLMMEANCIAGRSHPRAHVSGLPGSRSPSI